MKLSEAAGILATLQHRDYTIKELVDIVKSVDNLKSKTLESIQPAIEYDSTNQSLVKISDLVVSIKYQRRMRLYKIIDKLKAEGGFNKDAAGHVDVAQRPNGKLYLWDGFRRVLMAALAGHEFIPASIIRHRTNMTDSQCEKYEAKMFKTRNSDTEAMKPEEIFRSKVVYDDEEALRFLDFLKQSNLDVEVLNPNNKELSGMAHTYAKWDNESVTESSLILASYIIQNAWKSDPQVSGYLLCGLAKLLDVNKDLDNPFEEDDILECFQDYINTKPPRKQSDLTGRRLSKAPDDSVAYCIATQVLNFSGSQVKEMMAHLKLDNNDIDVIDSDD